MQQTVAGARFLDCAIIHERRDDSISVRRSTYLPAPSCASSKNFVMPRMSATAALPSHTSAPPFLCRTWSPRACTCTRKCNMHEVLLWWTRIMVYTVGAKDDKRKCLVTARDWYGHDRNGRNTHNIQFIIIVWSQQVRAG